MAEKRKKYRKPDVIHREKVEVLAAVCNSAWVTGRVCMKTTTPCAKARD